MSPPLSGSHKPLEKKGKSKRRKQGPRLLHSAIGVVRTPNSRLSTGHSDTDEDGGPAPLVSYNTRATLVCLTLKRSRLRPMQAACIEARRRCH